MMSKLSARDTKHKPLSKDAIYAPLSSYTNPTKDENALRKRYKALKDYQVCDYFENVSNVYTGNDSQVSWMRSAEDSGTLFAAGTSAINRSRHLDGKIFARSLVLVGGGIHDASGTSAAGKRGRKRSRSRLVGFISNRKRRGICRKVGLSLSYCPSSVGEAPNDNPAEPMNRGVTSKWPSVQTLHQLHQLWSTYARELVTQVFGLGLGRDSKSGSSAMNADQISKICSKHLELCGSVVQIGTCPSHPHYVGKRGIVVDETENTWRLFAFNRYEENQESVQTKAPGDSVKIDQKNRNKETGSGAKDNVENDKPSKSSNRMALKANNELEFVIVPKRNSSLALRLSNDVGVIISGNKQ